MVGGDGCVYFRGQLNGKGAAKRLLFSCTSCPSAITEKPGGAVSKALPWKLGAEETDLIVAAKRDLT